MTALPQQDGHPWVQRHGHTEPWAAGNADISQGAWEAEFVAPRNSSLVFSEALTLPPEESSVLVGPQRPCLDRAGPLWQREGWCPGGRRHVRETREACSYVGL